MSITTQQSRPAYFALRAVGAFLLFAALMALLYVWGYYSYPSVAEWTEAGNHDALVYKEETYLLCGQIGKRGLTERKYPVDKILGKVRDDGVPVITEAATLPPDAEEGETVKPIPPDGTPTLARDHAYVLYSVEKEEDLLLVLEKNGKYFLYYREGTPNPLD